MSQGYFFFTENFKFFVELYYFQLQLIVDKFSGDRRKDYFKLRTLCLTMSKHHCTSLMCTLRGVGGHSNLGCHNTFLKIVSLLKTLDRKGIKVYIVGKLSALAFQKYQIIAICATGKSHGS